MSCDGYVREIVGLPRQTTHLKFTTKKESCFAIPNPRNDAGRGPRRPAPTHRRHTLARKGDRRRSVAGRTACDDPETRALLGARLRLAHVRGETERPAEFHERARWTRHAFHSPSA